MQWTHSWRAEVEYKSVRRTPRYSLVVDLEMTDALSEIQIRARTKMLSMGGFGVESSTLFPKATSVRIRLLHQGAEVRALGRVVYSCSDLGMGVAFTTVEREDERILECWIADYLIIPVK
jgi:hypothetical protein